MNKTNIFKKFLAFLNVPYTNVIHDHKLRILVGICSGIFLVYFKPISFAASGLRDNNWFFLGYGPVSYFALYFCYDLFPKMFRKLYIYENYTIKSYILWNFINVTTVIVANCLYIFIFNHFRISAAQVFQLSKFCYAAAFYPVLIVTFFEVGYRDKKIKQLSNIHFHSPETVSDFLIDIYEKNNKDFVRFYILKLMYVESDKNYLNIYIDKGETDPQVLKVRLTLKEFLQQTEQVKFYMRCHKAFVVNRHCISDVVGNTKKCALKINKYNIELPLSRDNFKEFKDLMKA